MTEHRCDICGELLKGNWGVFKVKKAEWSFDGWFWDRLEVHDECWQLLCCEIRNKRNVQTSAPTAARICEKERGD